MAFAIFAAVATAALVGILAIRPQPRRIPLRVRDRQGPRR